MDIFWNYTFKYDHKEISYFVLGLHGYIPSQKKVTTGMSLFSMHVNKTVAIKKSPKDQILARSS